MLIQDNERRWRWTPVSRDDTWGVATPSLETQMRVSVKAGEAMLEYSTDDHLSAPITFTLESTGLSAVAPSPLSITPNQETPLRTLLEHVTLDELTDIKKISLRLNTGLPLSVTDQNALERIGITPDGGALVIRLRPGFMPEEFRLENDSVVLWGSVQVVSDQLNPSNFLQRGLSQERFERLAPGLVLLPTQPILPFIERGPYLDTEVNVYQHIIDGRNWVVHNAKKSVLVRPLCFEGETHVDVRLRTTHESRAEWAEWPPLEVVYSHEEFSLLEQGHNMLVIDEHSVQTVRTGQVHGIEAPRYCHSIENHEDTMMWIITDITESGLEYTPDDFRQTEDDVVLVVGVHTTLPWSIDAGWSNPLQVEFDRHSWNTIDREKHRVIKPPNNVFLTAHEHLRGHSLALVHQEIERGPSVEPQNEARWVQQDAREHLIVEFHELRKTGDLLRAEVRLRTYCEWADWPETVECTFNLDEWTEFQEMYNPTVVTEHFITDIRYQNNRPVEALTLTETEGAWGFQRQVTGLTDFNYGIEMNFMEVSITTNERIHEDIDHLSGEDAAWNIPEMRTERLEIEESIKLAEYVAFVFSPHEKNSEDALHEHICAILERMQISNSSNITKFSFQMPSHFALDFPIEFPLLENGGAVFKNQPKVFVKTIHKLPSSEMAKVTSADDEHAYYPLMCPNRTSPQEGHSPNRALTTKRGEPIGTPYGSYTTNITFDYSNAVTDHNSDHGLQMNNRVYYIKYSRRYTEQCWLEIRHQWLSYIGFHPASIESVWRGNGWLYGELIQTDTLEPQGHEVLVETVPENSEAGSLSNTTSEGPEQEQATQPHEPAAEIIPVELSRADLVGLVAIPNPPNSLTILQFKQTIEKLVEALKHKGDQKYVLSQDHISQYFSESPTIPMPRRYRRAVRHLLSVKFNNDNRTIIFVISERD